MLVLMIMVMRFVRPVVTSQDHLRRPIAEILEIASGILDHVPPLTHRSVALVVEEKCHEEKIDYQNGENRCKIIFFLRNCVQISIFLLDT